MSGKLDQSLDEILSTTHRNNTNKARRGRRAPAAGRTAAPTAPAGGIKKSVKGPHRVGAAHTAVPTGPQGSLNNRIQVSNLPKDVDERQIKEYFTKAVGPLKRVELNYGPGGISRGIATVTFMRPDGPKKAVEVLNNTLIDGKPIKVDVILDARSAAALPAPKTLSERMVQPKAQPKSAAVTKTAGAAGRGKSTRGRGRGGRNARPAKKTAEELDSEMADYFDAGASAEPVAAQPTADAAMDEIS